MYRGGKILFVLFFILTSSLFSQQDPKVTVDEVLNHILDEATIEKEDSQLYDLIEQLLENPININEATKSELLKIPFMDIESANIIFDYRKKNGKLFSTSEIKMIEGLSSNISKTLQYFITVRNIDELESPPFFGLYSLKFRSRITQDIQERKGFTDSIYSGSSIKAYNRIKLQVNPNISMGGLMEKDAGESSYLDFYSAHVSINQIIPSTNIILGDFTVEFGQGLSMWSPYSFSKSSDATNSVIKRKRNISPYTSSGEANFLRGGAFYSSIMNFSLTAFYSNMNLDATLSDDEKSFSSIKIDGFHRTDNDLNKIDKINDKTIGAIFSYSILDKANIGFLYYEKSFSHFFNPLRFPTINNDHFKFASITYDAAFNKIFFVGELSYFQNSFASINTVQLALAKNFIVTAIIRNYPKDYFSFYANGFGEKSTTNNEFGIYTGFKWKSEFGEINFYFDQFKYPHPSNQMPLPSNGDELSLSYFNKITKDFSFYLRYFNENKETLEIVDDNSEIIKQNIQKIRGEFTLQVNRSLRLKSRLELLYLSQEQTSMNETGFLLFQDIQVKLPINLTLYGRIIFFQTDSYSSRIYQFENDLTGVMNNPALFGTGIKWYFLIRYKLMNYIHLSLKYSELFKPNERYLGSGYNLIPSNLDNRMSFQADISF
ncbi:MAG: helix-hairpin-helix domain-containing protein [Bacteroidota bacterium]